MALNPSISSKLEQLKGLINLVFASVKWLARKIIPTITYNVSHAMLNLYYDIRDEYMTSVLAGSVVNCELTLCWQVQPADKHPKDSGQLYTDGWVQRRRQRHHPTASQSSSSSLFLRHRQFLACITRHYQFCLSIHLTGELCLHWFLDIEMCLIEWCL